MTFNSRQESEQIEDVNVPSAYASKRRQEWCIPSIKKARTFEWTLARSLVVTLAFLVFQALLSTESFAASSDEQDKLEYQLKAVCLYNFSKYVKWPSGVFSTPEDPIQICIAEPSPFGDIFAPLADKKAQNRSVLTRTVKLSDFNSLKRCNILYAASLGSSVADQLEKALKPLSVLTVTEKRGEGTINFQMIDGKVRFEIDNSKAKQSGLIINSQVLKLAVNVIDDD